MKDFIVNNYVIIIIIASFLVFALIGFAVDTAKNKNSKKEEELLNKPNDDVDTSVIDQEVAEDNIPSADENK